MQVAEVWEPWTRALASVQFSCSGFNQVLPCPGPVLGTMGMEMSMTQSSSPRATETKKGSEDVQETEKENPRKRS